MSLANVLYPPPTGPSWSVWSLHNYQHHLAIETAVKETMGVTLTPYRIYPADQNSFQDWLEQHQRAHTAFCRLLGIQGQDLSGLDWNDKAKKDAWLYSHFIQHQSAAKILKLPIL